MQCKIGNLAGDGHCVTHMFGELNSVALDLSSAALTGGQPELIGAVTVLQATSLVFRRTPFATALGCYSADR